MDIIKIVSEFTFLFWLDNFEHINEKRIQFGETYPDEIGYLCDELKNIWDKNIIQKILKVLYRSVQTVLISLKE